MSAFTTILALYYSLEQAFCTDDVKQKFVANDSRERDTANNEEEANHLLGENIAMDELTSSDLQEVNLNGVPQRSEVNSDVSEVNTDYTCHVPALCIGGDFGEEVDERRRRDKSNEEVLQTVQSAMPTNSLRFSDGDFGASATCVDAQPTLSKEPSIFTSPSQPHSNPTVLPTSYTSWSQASSHDCKFQPHLQRDRTLRQEHTLWTPVFDDALVKQPNQSPESSNATTSAMPTSSNHLLPLWSSNDSDPKQPMKLPECTPNQMNVTDDDVPLIDHIECDTPTPKLLPGNCDIHSTLPIEDHSFTNLGDMLGDERTLDDFQTQCAIETDSPDLAADPFEKGQTILPKPCKAAFSSDADCSDRTIPKLTSSAVKTVEPSADYSSSHRRTPPFLAE